MKNFVIIIIRGFFKTGENLQSKKLLAMTAIPTNTKPWGLILVIAPHITLRNLLPAVLALHIKRNVYYIYKCMYYM